MQILLASAKIMREGAALGGAGSLGAPGVLSGSGSLSGSGLLSGSASLGASASLGCSASLGGAGCLPSLSVPHFQAQTELLAADMARKSASELSEVFGCSMAIAQQNKLRYAQFGSDEAELMPAIFAYYGQAYKHLKADSMSLLDLEWANEHLWISSCLYGLLRPFDGINLYRMEGGFPLPCTRGRKVTEFWRPFLTDLLIESVKADDGILVYLDTEEFRALFDWKRVLSEVTVIEPEFHVMKNGKMTTPSVWAKTCRGAMTRFIIENRICEPAGLRDFSYEGFAFHACDGFGAHACDGFGAHACDGFSAHACDGIGVHACDGFGVHAEGAGRLVFLRGRPM